MDVLQIQSLSISLLLKLIDTIVKRFHFVFLLRQFRYRLGKQEISLRFCNIRWLSISSIDSLSFNIHQQVALFLKVRLVPIISYVKAMPQVSLCRRSSDFEMNLTSNLLFQSDEFVIVHLLLARANAVVKSAEHKFGRRPSLLLEAWQGFPQNLESKTIMTGCMVKKICPQFRESESPQLIEHPLVQ